MLKCAECRYFEQFAGGPPVCHIKLPEWARPLNVFVQYVSLDGGCDLGKRPSGPSRKQGEEE